jgi:hypothetical protein
MITPPGAVIMGIRHGKRREERRRSRAAAQA